MFKYGTLKLFFAKIFIGVILIFFSLVLFVSLVSFNVEDPGFKKIADEQNIHNYLGYFGAKLSSFMLVFWGHASYIISLFFFFMGLKFLFGIGFLKFFRRFFLILLGITFINLFMTLINFKNYELGLVATFLFDLIFQVYREKINNYTILYGGGSIIFLVGIIMVLYGLNIKIKFIAKLVYIIYPLRFILKLNFIKLVFKFFSIFKNKDKKISYKGSIKSEPIFAKNKKSFLQKNLSFTKTFSKNPADKYTYDLPSFDMLLKSSKREIYTREIEKINNNAAIKLEETLANIVWRERLLILKAVQ